MHTEALSNPQQRPKGARVLLSCYISEDAFGWGGSAVLNSIWKQKVMADGVRMDVEVLCSYLSFHRGKFLLSRLVSVSDNFSFRRIVGGSLLLFLFFLLIELKLWMMGCWWERPSVVEEKQSGARWCRRSRACAKTNARLKGPSSNYSRVYMRRRLRLYLLFDIRPDPEPLTVHMSHLYNLLTLGFELTTFRSIA